MKYFALIALTLVVCTTLTSAWAPYRKWRKFPFISRQDSVGFMPKTDDDAGDRKPFRLVLRRLGPVRNPPGVCDPCPPGFGLVSMCNETARTVCRECTLGVDYSPREPHFSQCTFCSKCGENMYEDAPCLTTQDTFCDSCSTKKGVRNVDYWRRCPVVDNNEVNSRLGADDEDTPFDWDRANKDVGSSESEELSKPLDGNKFTKDLFGKELNDVYRETDKELEQTSKEEKEIDNFEKDLEKVYENIGKELADQTDDDDDDEDDSNDSLKKIANSSQLEKGVEQSVKDTPYLKLRTARPIWEQNEDTPNQWNLDDDVDDFKPIRIDNDFRVPKRNEIVYKPSDHGYPYEELLHPDVYRAKQVRKVFWLYCITAVMLVVALMFITCYAGSYYKRRRAAYRFAAVTLNDHDHQVIRQCAQRLENDQMPVDTKRRNPFDRKSVNVFENPLEEYLEEEPTVTGSQESLIPNVHKSTKLEIA